MKPVPRLAAVIARYRIKRPFSRKLRLAPAELLRPTGRPDRIDRIAAEPALDPLAGALAVLRHAYAGDGAAARAAMERLATGGTPGATARLLASSDLRKLAVACFLDAVRAGPPDSGTAGLLLDFARRFDPAFADLAKPSPGQGAVRPIDFDYVGRLSPRLRVVLMFRTRYSAADSRPHDFGERLTTAFAAAGVRCDLLPCEADPAEIGEADLVLFDDDGAFPKDPVRKRSQIEKVRARSRRLGVLALDPWGKGFSARLAQAGTVADFVWTMAPGLRAGAGLAPERFCLIPFPCGFGPIFDELARRPPAAELGFCGTVEDYNVHRYFWLLAEIACGAELDLGLTAHRQDHLTVEASLRGYLERLLAPRACLSLTMRATGDRILVGRAFDILRGGRLLVQERTPDAGFYLVAGEHFIEVPTPAEMPAAREQLRSGDRGEAIRAAGAAFHRERYGDVAVARHLATWV